MKTMDSPKLFKGHESGRFVLGIFFNDSAEWVTFPSGKFWNTLLEDVSGLWNMESFNKRFTAVK